MVVSKNSKCATILALSLFTGACSGSVSFSIGGVDYGAAAEGLIEDTLAEEIGLGEVTADCEDTDDLDVDDTFNCTGTLTDGSVIEFLGLIEPDDNIDVNSTNLMSTDFVEQALFDNLVEQAAGRDLELDDVECGTGFVLLDNMQSRCQLTPPDADELTMIVTFEDTSSGIFSFDFE